MESKTMIEAFRKVQAEGEAMEKLWLKRDERENPKPKAPWWEFPLIFAVWVVVGTAFIAYFAWAGWTLLNLLLR